MQNDDDEQTTTAERKKKDALKTPILIRLNKGGILNTPQSTAVEEADRGWLSTL